MNNTSPWATIVIALLSSGTLWSVLQWLLGRRTRKQQNLKDAEALSRAQREARDSEEKRIELLAEAQRTAQRTALESAAARFDSLDEDYRACRDGLRDVRGVAFLLADAMNLIMSRVQSPTGADEYIAVLTAGDVEKARFAIGQARERLYQ
jgi:hypothetical protein